MAVKKTSKSLSEKKPPVSASTKAALTPDAVEDKFQQVLKVMATGVSAREACKKAKLPRTSFYRLIGGDEDKRGQYARAREACADAQFDDLDELAEQVKTGKIKPDAGRVAADIMKFKLARMRPEAYGDKVALEHSGIPANPPSLIVNFSGGKPHD